ncbi:helix-turn-helix domain-containing protein [Mycobacterium sp. pUA109]|uniref:helix-turn-helix domain-containing protein n=1 Tax=Mycobacterium sp. pUA109 TaxID=3238982 RepID=UPI00351B9E5A
MSVLQARDDRTVLTVDATEIDEARTVSTSLAEVRRTTAKIEFEIGSPGRRMVPIPAALAGLIQSVIEGVSRGATVTIHSLPRELTTTTAAKMLGISRPTLMKLIAEEKLPAHKVGTHTRLLTSDVTSFHEKRRADQRRAFEELRKLDDEVGIEP